MRKISALILAAAVLLSAESLKINTRAYAAGEDTAALSGRSSYEIYMAEHSEAEYPSESIAVALDRFTAQGNADCNISTAAESIGTLSWQGLGTVSWDFDVGKAGFYCFEMNYFSQSENNSYVSFGIDIDGVFPFDEAREVRFDRYWRNEHSIRLDSNHKDQLLPDIVKYNCSITSFAKSSGVSDEPLWFYLSSGTHKLTLHGVSTDFYISSMRFCGKTDISSYGEIRPTSDKLSETPALIDNTAILVEAEMPKYTNSAALRPTSEPSDYAVSPSHPYDMRYNTIGADSWNTAGQTLFYEVTVPSAGYYALNIKCRLNTGSGLPCSRRICVNGVVPCREFNEVKIPYSADWQAISPTAANGEPIFVQLKAGKNLIAFEAINGESGDALRRLNNIISELCDCAETDGINEKFGYYAEELISAKNALEAASGRKINASEIDVIADLLKKYEKNAPDSLSDLKKALNSGCGWIEKNSERSVEMDYFELRTVHEEFRPITRDFFKQLVFGFQRFVGSFFSDHGTISDNTGEAKLSVSSDKDNAQIINSISGEYSEKINVITNSGNLLEAALSGNAPDVALFVDENDVYELASRGLIVNLATLPDYGTVENRSPEGVSRLYEYNGGVYGIPLTNSFPMMFCREDILNELGLAVPESWDDLTEMLPALNERGYTAGLGCPSDFSAGNAFMLMMSQSGQSLDSDYAKTAFSRYTDYYTKYGCPQDYDAFRLFRTGRMPIVIADYAEFYGKLSEAGEICGLWSIAHVPGTYRGDEGGRAVLDFSTDSNSLGAVIFADSRNIAEAWSFVSWFSQSDTQTKYGVLKEAVSSEIYAPSSLTAMSNLRVYFSGYNKLRVQTSQINEMPKNKFSVTTERRIYRAFLETVNGRRSPADAITRYLYPASAEISRNKE